MRFWITKNSELPVREQLFRQVLLGILSEDLPSGHKLPSVRAIARRHHIHSNTVSAAFHDLLEQGWLEFRRGSGLYVRPLNPSGGPHGELDHLLAKLLQDALAQGFQPDAVLDRLTHLLHPRTYRRILIVEPEPAMREILQTELGEHLPIPIEFLEPSDCADLSKLARGLVVALPTRATKVRRSLPPGVVCIPLRLRSVTASLEGQSKPGPDTILSIVSRSAEIRHWARAMLIAVGIDPQCLLEVDASSAGWQSRVNLAALIVTDVLAARQLPAYPVRVFRVVADSSITELKQFCGAGGL